MKDIFSSPAKISRPVIKEVFLRGRLFSRLDESKEAPVIWISGPPGSGKTTLVSSYIEARGLRSLWYQVDPGDAEAATFFHYMTLAAKKAAPRKKKPLPSPTPETLPNLAVFTRRFFQDLFSRIKTQSVVVIDNYQDALNSETFNTIVRDGLSEIPDGVSVIVISHNDPPAAYARMRAYGRLKLITWDELRLTIDESKGLAFTRVGEQLSDEVIEDLQKKTQGWAAGLVLLIERMKADGLSIDAMDGPTPELIFDYFVSEIFDKLDAHTRQFLLESAWLPNMTGRMAERITGAGDADSILSGLAAQNCFTLRHVHNRKVHYQYHYLFRQFLMARGTKELGPEAMVDVKLATADALVANGQASGAADLFIDCREWGCLAGLVLKEAPEMVARGRDETVERWIRSLPDETVGADPWLSYWMGRCRLSFNPTESMGYFESSYEAFRAAGDLPGMMKAVCGVINSISSECRDYSQFDPWIEAIDEHYRAEQSSLDPVLEDQITSSMLRSLTLRRPDHPDFDLWRERAHKIVEGTGDATLRVLVACNLIIHYNWTGELASSAMVVDAMRRIPLSDDVPQFVIARKISGEQAYYFFAGLYEESLRAGEEGLEHARASGVKIWEVQYHAVIAIMGISFRDLQRAEESIDLMNGCFKELEYVNNLHLAWYYFIIGYLALSKGDLHLSKSNFEKGCDMAGVVGSSMPEINNLTGLAQVLHELGDDEGAHECIARMRKVGLRLRSSLAEYTCLVLEAHFALEAGDDETGLEALGRAFAIGRDKGYIDFLGWRAELMAPLAARAIEEGIETDYAIELIKKRGLLLDSPPVDVEQWPWPVRIYTLGRFEVVVEGESLTFSRKTPKKPLEMLKALVSLGCHDISETRISDVLWPDADGDDAHNAFTTTLRRLRKIIGVEDAIELVDGRLTLNPRKCWVDFLAVERLLEKAEAATGTDIAPYVDKAAGLYRGRFMADDEAAQWAAPMAERLKGRLVKNIGKAARALETSDEYKKAARFYQLGIEVDEFAEHLYERLMVCYKRLGSKTKAIDVYSRLKKTLSINLGISPSDRVGKLYDSLLRE